MDTPVNHFTGWAIVELFGHQREVAHVTTEYYGTACLFRLDVPEIPEREYTLTEREWIGNTLAPVGSKVQRPAIAGRSRLIGPGAIYAINPCTEDAARQAIEKMFRPPLKLIEVPANGDAPQLPAASAIDVPSEDDWDDEDEAEADLRKNR